MSSKIEQQIDQIEDYIDNCKYQPFSNSKIIVDRDEFDGLLQQLRAKVPEEIKHYQRIINNKEAILADARKKAEELINEATVHTNELINEHEIMQQAYAQANEVVKLASKQAQDILDKAIGEANSYRASAVQYMDDMLQQLENITAQTMENSNAIYSNFANTLGGYAEILRQNRSDLLPQEEEGYDQTAEATPEDGYYPEAGQVAPEDVYQGGAPQGVTQDTGSLTMMN
ncbi:MAG: vacuolar family H+-ATPase subunit H [Eubacteriales bacterium]|nr:vacuolar family H+-ATPase subunit H [Eubacteriales bacterium]